MTFVQFLDAHPGLIVVVTFIICLTLNSIVLHDIWSRRR